jgi:hypothetical protein
MVSGLESLVMDPLSNGPCVPLIALKNCPKAPHCDRLSTAKSGLRFLRTYNRISNALKKDAILIYALSTLLLSDWSDIVAEARVSVPEFSRLRA